MATNKRTINGTKFNVEELVKNAISSVESKTLDIEKSRKALIALGHSNPDETIIIRYARESAILDILAHETGANFTSQIGKIDFSNETKAISSVGSYLNRRINGQHQRWTSKK